MKFNDLYKYKNIKTKRNSNINNTYQMKETEYLYIQIYNLMSNFISKSINKFVKNLLFFIILFFFCSFICSKGR